MDLRGAFGDVKYVCMGGSNDRAYGLAHRLAVELAPALSLPVGAALTTIGKTERFVLYKVGPVLSVSHGMGFGSLSILLHEITKLLHYAGATKAAYIRVGTSGGVGVEPGTVVAATAGVNLHLEPFLDITVCGRTVRRPATMDAGLVALAQRAARAHTVPPRAIAASEKMARELAYFHNFPAPVAVDRGGAVPLVTGTTLGADGFYEEQARLDGAICEITEGTAPPPNPRSPPLCVIQCRGLRSLVLHAAEKMAWLNKAASAGVVRAAAPLAAAGTHTAPATRAAQH